MTTAYAQPSMRTDSSSLSSRHLRLVPKTSPAQGPETVKLRDVMQTFRSSATAQGQSPELTTVFATLDQLLRELTQNIENVRELIQDSEEHSYNHVPVRSVFSVQATYQFVGKLKPRQFSLDE